MNIKPALGIFVPRVLDRSMTFVDRQLQSYTKFEPILLGLTRVDGYQPGNRFVHTVDDGYSPLRLREVMFRQLGYAPKFYRQIRKANIALLHGHFGWSLEALFQLKDRLKLPTVITFHGRDATLTKEALSRTFAGRRYLKLRPRAFQVIDRVIAVSNFTRSKLIETGWDPAQVITIYNGIDVSAFAPRKRKRERLVLGIGRFVEKKGFGDLLEASAILKSKDIDHRLVLVGDGPLAQSYKNLAARLNLDVTFPGFLSTDEVQEWISRATVLCVPSITANDGDSEGLPTVLLEAQAMETPVVATRHAGNAEAVIDNETGFLVEERMPFELGAVLEKVLTDDGMVRDMGLSARRFVSEKFSSADTAANLENLYTELLLKN